MKTQKLSAAQFQIVSRFLSLPVTEGEKREIYICQTKGCGKIQAHDFIPFGIGRGIWRNPCHCNAVDPNWIFRAQLLISK